jgi:hypothetical protein
MRLAMSTKGMARDFHDSQNGTKLSQLGGLRAAGRPMAAERPQLTSSAGFPGDRHRFCYIGIHDEKTFQTRHSGIGDIGGLFSGADGAVVRTQLGFGRKKLRPGAPAR